MTFDLIIRNGTVVDGSGGEPYQADVGIREDRIVFVGTTSERGRREINADGHVVSPGFIDGHTHMDAQVMWDADGSCSNWHGVTSTVMGNCGFTLAPIPPDNRNLVTRCIERAEDIAAEVMEAGIDWSWETFAEYLDVVDRVPKSINYSAHIGHSALRAWAMRERAFVEPANEEDMATMERELVAAIKAGAAGFSTSRANSHETPEGDWVPSRMAHWPEVCRLVETMVGAGGRMFEITVGPGAIDDPSSDRVELLRSQVAPLALATGAITTFSVGAIKPRCYQVLDVIDEVARGGGRMVGQSHPRGVSNVLSFKTHLPFDELPEWSKVRACDLATQRRLFEDPTVRAKLVDEATYGPYGRAVGAELRPPRYEEMEILRQPVPPHVTVAEEAQARGMNPADLMIQLALDNDFEVFFVQPIFPIDTEATVDVLKHPRTIMTFSDTGAHVSQIMDASIHTLMLAYWVREREEFTLAEGVRMMTSAPAHVWGFYDRGLIKEGFAADINVFDPNVVAPLMPKVVHDLPGGGVRLEQRATGFLSTVVGGKVTIENGESTGIRSGRLLRYANGRA